MSPPYTHTGAWLQGTSVSLPCWGRPIGKAFTASGTHTRPDCDIRGPSASRKAWSTGRKLRRPLAAPAGVSLCRSGEQRISRPAWFAAGRWPSLVPARSPQQALEGVSGSSTSWGEARSPSSTRNAGAGSPGLPTASPQPRQGLRLPWSSLGSPSRRTAEGGPGPKPQSEPRSPGTGEGNRLCRKSL